MVGNFGRRDQSAAFRGLNLTGQRLAHAPSGTRDADLHRASAGSIQSFIVWS